METEKNLLLWCGFNATKKGNKNVDLRKLVNGGVTKYFFCRKFHPKGEVSYLFALFLLQGLRGRNFIVTKYQGRVETQCNKIKRKPMLSTLTKLLFVTRGII